MFRQLAVCVAIACLLLSPAIALAGGPPGLCLPIDGATAENAPQCAKLIATLGKDIERAAMKNNDGQWFVIFHFNRENLRLTDIEKALKGSPFTVARDKLRLFGDVILEVDLRGASADKLLADFKAVKNASVSGSAQKNKTLLVTLTMPGPAFDGPELAKFGDVSFRQQTFKSEGQSEAVKASELPTYDALRSIVSKHNASLTTLRWDCWGCRVLGCVATDSPASKVSAANTR